MPTGDLFHQQYQDMVNFDPANPSRKGMVPLTFKKTRVSKPFHPKKIGSKTDVNHPDSMARYKSPWPKIDKRYIELVGNRIEERIVKTLPLLSSNARDEITKFVHYAKRSPAALASVQMFAEKEEALPLNLMRLLHAFAIVHNRKLSFGRRSQLARLVMTSSTFNAGKRL